jgi:hypothetical protein
LPPEIKCMILEWREGQLEAEAMDRARREWNHPDRQCSFMCNKRWPTRICALSPPCWKHRYDQCMAKLRLAAEDALYWEIMMAPMLEFHY